MRKLAAVLTAYLLMNVVLAAVVGAVDFSDVPQGHWAREDIRYVTDRGIFLGRTADTFSPDSGMTRGQMAMVLYRLAGQPDTDAVMAYTDVPEGMYYYNAIRWATKKAIFTTEKLTTNTLNPDEPITRGEFAVMLHNYDAAKNGASAGEPTENPFTDMDGVTPEVRNALLNWAYPQGILRGTTTTTMNPNGRLTRAHVAAMLCRYDRLTAENKEPDGFPFRVLPPHTTEEFLTGNLSPNDTYTLVMTEEYAGSFFTVTSDNVKIIETVSTPNGWEIRTRAEGEVFLKVTNQRTGQQRRLTVNVGGGTGESIWPGVDAAKPFQSAVEYPDGPGPYRTERLEIIWLANEVRVRNGAKECVVSEALMSAAQKLAETKPQGHDGQAEIQFRADFGCQHGVGCNLYRSTNAGNVKYLPPTAVKSWDQSPGHHAAMINKGADTMGIGLYYDEETKTAYCVMYVGDCQFEGQFFDNPHN